MKKLLHTIEKCVGIYRWHPVIALRYLPMVEAMEGRRLRGESVLEVGSAGLGIAPYLKQKVVGVDITFSPPFYEKLIGIRASALNLPFAANSFKTVLSTDMLEHLAPQDRKQAISEMLRVAEKLVCIGVPVGKSAQFQDRELADFYKTNYKSDFDFFTEHAQNGLPEKEELREMISDAAEKSGKKISIYSRGLVNIRVRYWLMRGWISKSFLLNLIFRKIFLIFIPVLSRLNRGPTYSELFIITII